jgi:hypothetical protein
MTTSPDEGPEAPDAPGGPGPSDNPKLSVRGRLGLAALCGLFYGAWAGFQPQPGFSPLGLAEVLCVLAFVSLAYGLYDGLIERATRGARFWPRAGRSAVRVGLPFAVGFSSPSVLAWLVGGWPGGWGWALASAAAMAGAFSLLFVFTPALDDPPGERKYGATQSKGA